MKKLYYVGTDNWDRPIYKDDNQRLWKDLNLGRGKPELYRSSNDEMDGEPDYPVSGEFEIVEAAPKESPYAFQYQMLSMLESKCRYYLGHGNRSSNIFDDGTGRYCIDEMKRLWHLFPDAEKPEWLTFEQICDYEKQILGGK